jgi:type IV pilus modification protein PilV
MNSFNRNSSTGFGLIEILIALVVVSIGLLSIAGLQGSLLTSNSDVKARNEGMDLAREIMEESRNYITDGTAGSGTDGQYYIDLAAGTTSETITGVNTTFTRTITISDDVQSDGSTASEFAGDTNVGLKKIQVNVGWTDQDGNAQNIFLTTFVSFTDPAKTASVTAGDAASTDSPLDSAAGSGSSEKESTDAPDVENNDNESQIEGGDTDSTSDDIYTRDNGKGEIEVIAPVTVGETTTYEVVLTVYGGVYHTISGTVYYDGDSYDWSNIRVLGSEPSACLFPVTTEATCGDGDAATCATYICLFGGDCSNGGDTGVCPDDVSDISDLNGGWYGNIGIAGTSDLICSLDSVAGSGSTPPTDPKRFYTATRATADSTYNAECSTDGTYFHTRSGATAQGVCKDNAYYDISAFEGINTSYKCQDFILGTTNCAGTAGTLGIDLPYLNVIRVLTGTTDNTALSTDYGNCTDVQTITVSGTVIWENGYNLIDSATMVGTGISAGNDGNCTTQNINGGSSKYSCTYFGDTWVGDVSVNVVDGADSDVSGCTGISASISSLSAPADHVQDLTISCTQGTDIVVVSGSITNYTAGYSVSDVQLDRSSCVDFSDSSYVCFYAGSSWQGDIEVFMQNADGEQLTCDNTTYSPASALTGSSNTYNFNAITNCEAAVSVTTTTVASTNGRCYYENNGQQYTNADGECSVAECPDAMTGQAVSNGNWYDAICPVDVTTTTAPPAVTTTTAPPAVTTTTAPPAVTTTTAPPAVTTTTTVAPTTCSCTATSSRGTWSWSSVLRDNDFITWLNQINKTGFHAS